MKKTEIILVGITVLSAIIRLLSVPGGVFLLTLSFFALALFYLLFSFLLFNKIQLSKMFRKESYAQVGWKRLTWSIITGVALFFMSTGLLFTLNHWGEEPILLTFGFVCLLLVGCLSLIVYIMRPSAYHVAVLVRCGIFLLAGLLLRFLV